MQINDMKITGVPCRIFDFVIKHTVWCLLALWLVSLAFKLLAWHMEPGVGRDASLYLIEIQKWHDTGVYPMSWIPPMLYALVRGVMFFGIGVEAAGSIVNIGMGSAVVFICYGIAFEATQDKRIALLSALFAAFHPGINDLSIEIQRDIPYLFFSGIAVWCAIAAFKRKKWYLWSSAGAVLALSFLTRYETAEFILLFPVLILAQAFCKRISWKQAVLFGSTFTVFMAAVFFTFIYLTGIQEFLNKSERYYSYKYDKVEGSFKTPQEMRQ